MRWRSYGFANDNILRGNVLVNSINNRKGTIIATFYLMLQYGFSWVISFFFLTRYLAVQEQGHAVLRETYNYELALPYFALASLLIIIAGLSLVLPVTLQNLRRFGFNHRYFWVVAIPSLVVMISPFLYYCPLLPWATPYARYLMEPAFTTAGGLLIGTTLGLSVGNYKGTQK